MPASKTAKTSRASFFSKFEKQAGTAWAKSKNIEAKAKSFQLPDGLTNAIGQLIGWEGKLNAQGKAQINLKVLVHEPEDCAGRKATTFHTMSPSTDPKTGEVRKTVKDKLDDLVSDLKLMGVKGLEKVKNVNGLEAVLDKYCSEVQPCFYFDTWLPSNQGRNGRSMVRLQIIKPAEGYEPSAAVEVTDDEAEADEPAEDEGEAVDEEAAEEGEGEEGGEESGEDEAGEAPTKGEVYMFKTGPKSEPFKVKVTAVDSEGETVDLKSVKLGKVFKTIPWARLGAVE